ncbi:MAG: hypothetical protein H8Z69_04185 [Nanohaloarchaea archaeon]|nr:hypothetical protein [Candidatus Nanohaloarchaea archaeon]
MSSMIALPGYTKTGAEAAIDNLYTAIDELEPLNQHKAESLRSMVGELEDLPYGINEGDYSDQNLGKAVDAYENLQDELDQKNYLTESGIPVGEAYSALGEPENMSVVQTKCLMAELGDMRRVEEVEQAVEKVEEAENAAKNVVEQIFLPISRGLDPKEHPVDENAYNRLEETVESSLQGGLY